MQVTRQWMRVEVEVEALVFKDFQSSLIDQTLDWSVFTYVQVGLSSLPCADYENGNKISFQPNLKEICVGQSPFQLGYFIPRGKKSFLFVFFEWNKNANGVIIIIF